jgi:hypothetical protein
MWSYKTYPGAADRKNSSGYLPGFDPISVKLKLD